MARPVARTAAAALAGPVVRDLALWAVLAGAGVFAYLEQAAPSAFLLLVLPLPVLAAAVALSRSRPAAAVFLANAACAAGLADDPPAASAYLLALAALTYLLALRDPGAGKALLLFAACTATDLALCAVLGVGSVYWFYTVTLIPVALVLPWLAGRYRLARLALVRDGWQRARDLEERQRSVAEEARLRERTRIAADMHDSLGHELSLVALRAGALELSPTLTEQDRADLAELRAAVSDTVGHLRDTIGVLRDGADADPVDLADLADLGSPVVPAASEPVEELARRACESGVTVELSRDGARPVLPPLVDRTLYRVVQESLTNAVKHAPGSAVRIRLVHGGGRTTVRVTNSAPPSPLAPPPPAGPAPGHRGLTGLRERVQMIGGTLHAAPRDGGYELLATLPDRVGPGPGRPAGAAGSREEPGTESVRRLTAARRSTRRRFAAAFAAPAALGLLMLGSAGYLAHQLTTCVLRPADFAAIEAGRDRAEFARLLPQRAWRHAPEAVTARPVPPGTVCAYYRSNGNLLDEVDVYRLCYEGSRLVAKDVLPGGPG
ncbi:sensor histidine kinase [Streptomyces xanthophaeus]|uniref:histidine kinase n=1 Tax=Streptomyces xanthophaeus TaxID=67385 RepID=A0A919GTN2_9ACTN|nr:histidine kinase [Streptomyces xanthophaeus]GHI83519.1 two-component sensor histidine kinase [Streptomyces xanthophaeus]